MKLRVYHTTGVLMESRDVPWSGAQEAAERASWSGFAVLQSAGRMIWFKGGREVARRGLRKVGGAMAMRSRAQSSSGTEKQSEERAETTNERDDNHESGDTED